MLGSWQDDQPKAEATSDSNETFSKSEEERKRDAVQAQDPLKRWKLFLEGLEWAIANTPPEKRRNRPRLPHQK